MAHSLSFQIVSDLHLECQYYRTVDFPNTAPYLALLGDIGQAISPGFYRFLERQVRRYDTVFFLLGNNESYLINVSAAKERVLKFALEMDCLRERGADIGKFVFLDQTRYDVDEHTTILGCSLYSNILPEEAKAVSARLDDFQFRGDWTISRHNDAHRSDLAWLNEQVRSISVAEPRRRVMIFTHYSPTVSDKASNPKHKKNTITSGYATDLRGEQCWKNDCVFLWAFGHTHFNCDFRQDGKRIIANQQGSSKTLQSAFNPCRLFKTSVGGIESCTTTGTAEEPPHFALRKSQGDY